MKVGMNLLLWTTDIGPHLYSIIDQLSETGYDGVEIPIGDPDPEAYKKLGDYIRQSGLTCTAVTSVFLEENPISDDPRIRQKGIDAMKWRMDMAKLLNAEVLCGPYHSAFAHFSGEPPTEEEKDRSVEVMSAAAEYAGKVDILLTPEALNRFECYLYNTLDEISELIKKVDHPNMKMIFDSHHAHIEEKNSATSIIRHKDLIGHVHISENDRGTPGKGQVNWSSVFDALKEINYDGWLTIEAFSRNNAEFANNINVWRNYQALFDEVFKEGYQFINEMWGKT